jgi:hypothetical protein
VPSEATRCCAPGPTTSVRSHRLQLHALQIDQLQAAVVLPHGGRHPLLDLDDQGVGQAAVDARLLDPLEFHQAPADRVEIDQRHRQRRLVQRRLGDGGRLHPAEPAQLDAGDREAGGADLLTDRLPHPLRHLEGDRARCDDDGHRAEEGQQAELARGLGRDWQPFEQPRLLGLAALLPAAAALSGAAGSGGGATGDAGGHGLPSSPSASATIRSTSSG